MITMSNARKDIIVLQTLTDKLMDARISIIEAERILIFNTFEGNGVFLHIKVFADNPMFGEYKTVVLDQKEGIVISTKSVLHKYIKHVLISGLSLQKSIARILRLTL